MTEKSTYTISSIIYENAKHDFFDLRDTLLLFEGMLWTLFFPLDFEGKIH